MIKKNRLPLFVLVHILLSTSFVLAQNNIFYNTGVLRIKSNTTLSSYSDFTNQHQGMLINDGLVYYFGDFTNDGNFTYTKKIDTGEVHFISKKQKNKRIEGNEVVDLNKVTFDLNKPEYYFDLKANLDIWGEANFKEGIIKVDDQVNAKTKQPSGLVSFMPKAQHKNSGQSSFVDGVVERIGAGSFVFPVGNKQHYRPAYISEIQDSKDILRASYVYDDAEFFATHQAKAPEIKQVNTREYWKIEKEKNKPTHFMLTLSWEEQTTLTELLDHPETLHLVYWQDKTKRWEDLGGIVDSENKTITTPAHISESGYFTLASIQPGASGGEDVIIYNYVNATGGDANDYFIIENINKYPENSVLIFNRWGNKVYETKNYNSRGNVFKGNHTRGGKLPGGTYYYLITYKKETKNRSYTVKKTGYLHLDTK